MPFGPSVPHPLLPLTRMRYSSDVLVRDIYGQVRAILLLPQRPPLPIAPPQLPHASLVSPMPPQSTPHLPC